MTLLKHELRMGRKALAIWTVSIGAFIVCCIFLFPEMAGQMTSVSDMFASIGAFTAAFGMDRLNFGTLTGFYAIECGNILGIGGALFAAMLSSNLLCKEEKERTAEYLLTHPVRRSRVVAGKLLAMLAQTVVMNAVVFLMAVASIVAIGYEIPWKELSLLHLSCFLVQVELEGICFGISAFLRRGGLGIGMGITISMYFLNIIANLTERAKFLKYITPFGYAEGADVLSDGALNLCYLAVGAVFTAIGILAAFWEYRRKDIH